MKDLIATKVENQDPSEMKQLQLDHCSSETIVGLTDIFSALEELSFVGVGLVSIDGLPNLPSLTTINLAYNEISGGLEVLAQRCPNLIEVDLNHNKNLKGTHTIAPLRRLEHLRHLSLKGSGIAIELHDKYRDVILYSSNLHLDSLDGCFNGSDVGSDVESEEEVEDEDGDCGENDTQVPAICTSSEKGDQSGAPQSEIKGDEEPMDSVEKNNMEP